MVESGHLLRAGLLALDEATGELADLPGVSPEALPALPVKGDAPALAKGIQARNLRLDAYAAVRWEIA